MNDNHGFWQRNGRLARWLLPNPGTIILIILLAIAVPTLAQQGPNGVNSISISTIPYQGRLAAADGTPITAQQNMEFRLYSTPTGGTPLWEEYWTGGNSVALSDGLFSVMLGSLNTNLTNIVQANNNLYLGVTVGTDGEMSPRVQLGSVPFSIWALSVADGSVTGAKIADLAVTTAKLAENVVTNSKIAADAVSGEKLAANTVTTDKIADGTVGNSDLANDAVTADKIAGGAVGNDELADESVTITKLTDGAVTSEKLNLNYGTQCLSSHATVNLAGNYQTQDIPNVILNFNLSKPSQVLIWMDGLAGYAQAQRGEVYVSLVLDTSTQTTAYANDTLDESWFNVEGQRLVSLNAGQHTLKLSASASRAGTLTVHSGSGFKTCINYIVLGEQ
ncbi:MAG: hypothetical protein IPJ94_17775 [Chloroflexi bacterium]|nr:hypothetical protein [Chloroflexota bacterium]